MSNNLGNAISGVPSGNLGGVIGGQTGGITGGGSSKTGGSSTVTSYQVQVNINQDLAERVLANEDLFKNHELRYLKNNMEVPKVSSADIHIDDPFDDIGTPFDTDTNSKGYRSDKYHTQYIKLPSDGSTDKIPDQIDPKQGIDHNISDNIPNELPGMFENETGGMFENQDDAGMFETQKEVEQFRKEKEFLDRGFEQPSFESLGEDGDSEDEESILERCKKYWNSLK